MPRNRYTLVLARSPQDAATYIKRAGIPNPRRAVASAGSIKGVQVADVHILPGFMDRRDCHSILAQLRWGRDIQRFDVEMPEPLPVDQGDGMGEQLTFDDFRDDFERQFKPVHKSVDPVIEFVSPNASIPQPAAESLDHVVTDDNAAERAEEMVSEGGPTLLEEDEGQIVPELLELAERVQARQRRSRCKVCGRLTMATYEANTTGHDIDAHTNSVAAPVRDELF